MKKVLRSRYTYVAVAAVVAVVLILVLRGGPGATKLTLSQFETDLATKGQVVTATVDDGTGQITGHLSDGTSYRVSYTDRIVDQLTSRMLTQGVDVQFSHSSGDIWGTVLTTYGPVVIFGGLLVYLIFSMQGGGGRIAQFGKARARTTGKE